jgi:hypothetical protein
MFDGQEVDLSGFEERQLDILPGGSISRMVCGVLKDVPVIVKKCPDPKVQLCIDELKPLFGLEKMDAGYGLYQDQRVLILRYHEHLGRVSMISQYPEWLCRQMIGMILFAALVRPGNPGTGNVLVLPNKRLLAIDEETGFKFQTKLFFHSTRRLRDGMKKVVVDEVRRASDKWPSDGEIRSVVERFFQNGLWKELIRRKDEVIGLVFDEVYK